MDPTKFGLCVINEKIRLKVYYAIDNFNLVISLFASTKHENADCRVTIKLSGLKHIWVIANSYINCIVVIEIP